MVFLRFFGLFLLATAFIALVVDGIKSIAATGIVFTPLGQGWFSLHPPSINLVQAIIERYTLPFLWDPVFLTVLLAPVWLVFGVLGGLFLYIGRKKRDTSIAYSQD
jgi:hypothetical protein